MTAATPDQRVEAYLAMLRDERRLSPHTLKAARRDLSAFLAYLEQRELPPDLHAVRGFLADAWSGAMWVAADACERWWDWHAVWCTPAVGRGCSQQSDARTRGACGVSSHRQRCARALRWS